MPAPYRPSIEQVEAAIAAWNRAEPRHQLVGSSWHTTFGEVLQAAFNTPRNPHLPLPPEDGKHNYGDRMARCLLCGAYGGSEEAEKVCLGEYRESGKMRSWAREKWSAERSAENG